MTTKTNAPGQLASKGPPRTAEDKLRVVLAAEQLKPDERDAFLRRQGVHDGKLEAGRTAMLQALGGRSARNSASRPADQRRIRELEKQLNRKD